MSIDKIAAKAVEILSSVKPKVTLKTNEIVSKMIKDGGKKISGSLDALSANAQAGIQLKKLSSDSNIYEKILKSAKNSKMDKTFKNEAIKHIKDMM